MVFFNDSDPRIIAVAVGKTVECHRFNLKGGNNITKLNRLAARLDKLVSSKYMTARDVPLGFSISIPLRDFSPSREKEIYPGVTNSNAWLVSEANSSSSSSTAVYLRVLSCQG